MVITLCNVRTIVKRQIAWSQRKKDYGCVRMVKDAHFWTRLGVAIGERNVSYFFLVRSKTTNFFKARKPFGWIAHVTLWPPNRNERLSFTTCLRYSCCRRRRRCLIFFDDFSIVDWRRETFALFCLWVPCTAWLIEQHFWFHWPARLNIYICCEHRIQSAFSDQSY